MTTIEGSKGQEFMEVETFGQQQPKNNNNKRKQLHNILGAQSLGGRLLLKCKPLAN
jgi:hypothetical protein